MRIPIVSSETVARPVPLVAELPVPSTTAVRSFDELLKSQEIGLGNFAKKFNIEKVRAERDAFIKNNLAKFLNDLCVPQELCGFSQPDLTKLSAKEIPYAEENEKYCIHDACGKGFDCSGMKQVSRHMLSKHCWDSNNPRTSTLEINAYCDNISFKNENGKLESYNLNHLIICAQLIFSGINYNQYENFLTPRVHKAMVSTARVGESFLRTKVFPQVYATAREVVRKFFNPPGLVPLLFSLIFDESTGCGKKVLSVVAVEYRSSAVVGVAVVDPAENCTADTLLKKVDGMLESVGLSWNSVVSVCSDNGPDAKGARSLISQQHPFIYCVPCLSHGLALVSTCVFGPDTKTKTKPFSDVHRFLTSFHSYFYGRGQTNQRRSRLKAALGAECVTAMDFVETRWGTLIRAAESLSKWYLELWDFLNLESEHTDNVKVIAELVEQISSRAFRLSLALLLTIFGNFVNFISNSQHSIAELNDSGNLSDLIASHQQLHDDLVSASTGQLDSSVKRLVLIHFAKDATDEICSIWMEKMRLAGTLTLKKFILRVQPTLEIMMIKACLDPILLYDISVKGCVLSKWYDSFRNAITSSSVTLDPLGDGCYPDLILDPFVNRMLQAKRISRNAMQKISSEWNVFHAHVVEFASSTSPARKKLAFGRHHLDSAEPLPQQKKILTSAEFWENAPTELFPHIHLLAENAALLIVSNAEVERGFNFIRHLLPFTRQGVLLDENFEKEFFVRANKRFFDINNLVLFQ